uniref:hypothetical protein n=1 Tax=uncultured Sphingomonas sp. TaxID=158754 RepID=UPI0035C965CB
MRRIIAIIVGTLIAFALIAGFEAASSGLYPISGDIAATDHDTLVALVASIPLPAKLIVVAGWLLAPFAGGWLCLRIGDWPTGGWIVAGLFLAAGLIEQFSFPHPPWMQLASVVLPLLGGWLAQRLHQKPYPGEPLLG